MKTRRVTNQGNQISLPHVLKETQPIFEKYGIQKAILFGSISIGRQSKRSEIDLILIQQTDKPYLERSGRILQDLHQAIPGREIEVYVYTPEELERISHKKFIQQALRDGKVIYESR